ncbi:MAG: DUF58 domain-containing protein [Lewinellaceae bacterium]|nr:DUF58 domain-containing protein [Saprospiraceae bacterium]MCB9331346.1 DUF58 domain-containing protein [Lewinellaceae bacterium]
MDTTELLKKVRKIEIKTRGLSRNLFTGGYHSAFKGRGMSFSEVRIYQPGDDVRTIDWNVTARTGEPHVKIFEEERELTVMLMVDISASSFFGSTGQSKKEVMTEICAVLAFSAIANNDKVGLLLFSDRVELFIPPQKGRQHSLRLIRELLNLEPVGSGTDLGAALQYARNVLRKRSVCFILSDFLTADYEAPLRIFSRRHDCIGLHSWDMRERTLPDVGLVRVADAESGSISWVDTSDAAFRKAYTRRFEERTQMTRSLFGRAGADFLSIPTTDSYAQALLRFFEQRAHRQ